mmetsp:Transcript_90074/g.179853  ORF Transcript_90074/g.179853 Transcript_90074/m.179853 type:complete len:256 (-) Transcript_90074:537-1304(-)
MDNAALSRFKEQIAAGQLDNAAETLVKLKISMISLQSLPPTLVESSSAAQERAYACDVLENAVLMSVALQDKDGFQRHISQLKPLYVVVQGGNKVNTVGLNLMFLLVENRLAEFHSELELLSEAKREAGVVAFPIQLEQYMMVGAFNQVLAAKAAMPSPTFAFFMDSIVETVRDSVAECAEVAYAALSLQAASKLLMLDSRDELIAFIESSRPSWVVAGEQITFQSKVTTKSSSLSATRLITESLSYASELERIV